MPSKKSAEDAVLNILHITDCHLSKHADGKLLGMNTRDSLDAVLALLQGAHSKPDYVLATGDLAQDASIEAYQYFKSRMAQFSCPVSWFPGNHDARPAMRQVVDGGPELNKVVQMGAWQFVLLDTLVEGKVHGWLEESELAVLEQALTAQPDLHTMVCLHHHPVGINSAWLDKIGLHNRDQLLEMTDRFDNVRALLWGHIHQQIDDRRNQVNLYASPSTCIQFLPKSDKFAVDARAPGYRWLKLYPDGHIETEVHRTVDFEFELDLQSDGY